MTRRGVLLAGAGWSVETMDLYLTGAQAGHGASPAHPLRKAEPIGDGPQLLIKRMGRMVAYVATPDDAAAMGVPLDELTVWEEW